MAQKSNTQNLIKTILYCALFSISMFASGIFIVQTVRNSDLSVNANQEEAAVFFQQGNALFKTHNLPDAELAFIKALKEDPSIQWAHHQLGRIYFVQNQLAKAEKEFTQEIVLHPDSSNAFYMRGLTHAFQNRFDFAEGDFRKFIAVHPESEAGNNDLAQVLFVQGKFQEAKEILLAILERYPGSFLAHQGLGAVYLEIGEYAQAKVHLQTAFDFAQEMDADTFRAYYPSLNPIHAEDGIKTVRAGLQYNLDLANSIDRLDFEKKHVGITNFAPYFQTSQAKEHGAVFLAASCAAVPPFEHFAGECTSWSVSLAAVPSGSVLNGTSVTYTATANADVGPTVYYIRIYEGVIQRASCPSGTSCQYSTLDNNITRSFVAKIERSDGTDIRATSGTVSTTWFAPAPTVSISALPVENIVGATVTVSWSSTNTTSCIASNSWSGAKATSGSEPRSLPVAGTYTFDISCTGPGGTASGSATVRAHSPPVLSAIPSGNVANGTSVTYTATVAVDVTPTPYFIRIYEGLTQQASCGNGTSCSFITVGTSVTRTFTAKLVDSGGTTFLTGNSVTTGWYPVPTSVTLSASPSGSQPNGTSVTYTATSNQSVSSPSPYFIRIYEGATLQASCGTGTTCTFATTGTSQTRTFVGKIEKSSTDVLLTSFSISTTWDSTPPTVGVSASPTSVTTTWQNTDATATTTCTDNPGGVGCEASANWRWLTYSSSPPVNCPTAFPGTGIDTYSGIGSGVTVTNHVWYCATAADTNGNRGYTSTPLEFKVDKIPPDITSSTVIVNGNNAYTNTSAATLTGVCNDIGDSGCSQKKNSNDNITFGVPSSVENYSPLPLASVPSDRFLIRSFLSAFFDLIKIKSTHALIVLSEPWGLASGEGTRCVWRKYIDAATNESSSVQDCIIVDLTKPQIGSITPATAIPSVATSFSATVADDKALDTCFLYVQPPAATVFANAGAMTLSAITCPIGFTGDCRTASKSYTPTVAGVYQMYAGCYDVAGNFAPVPIAPTTVTVAVPTLTFPTGTWQRLWYNDPELNAFNDSSFDQEGPNETAIEFDTNWGTGVLPSGLSDKTGFKSGRSFTAGFGGVYRFIIGSDDGARLLIGGSTFIDQWADGSFRAQAGSASMVAGTYNFELDFYEDLGNAQVSFDMMLSLEVTPATIFPGDPVTLRAFCLDVCEGKTVWFWTGTSPVASCVISLDTCSTTYFTDPSLAIGTVNFLARVDKNGDTDYNDRGEQSNTVGVSVSACLKTPTKIPDTVPVTVSTSSGTKTCNITIKHLGRDDSDSGAERDNVSYETLASDLNGVFPDSRKLGMDDNPTSGCQNNLEFTNAWTPASGALSVKSTRNAYNATHDLEYGYQISATDCVFQSVTRTSCALGSGNTLWLTCSDPSFSSGTKSVESVQPWWPNVAFPWKIDSTEHQYTAVECTQDSHCTAVGNTICNLDPAITTRTGYPQNTCIDSVAPTSKIKVVDTLVNNVSTPPGFAPNIPFPGDFSAFLRADDRGNTAKTYKILVEDLDNSGGSGLDTCHFSINNGQPKTRPCNGELAFKVGKTGADCTAEGNLPSTCSIKVWAKDRAVNENIPELNTEKDLNFFTSDERDYKLHDFSIFNFGVDWTPPTAQ